MEVLEAIRSRKSVRGFKPDPVPQEVIRSILETASRAPSTVNSQPWAFTVVTGEVMRRISQANIEKVAAGETPNPEIPMIHVEGKFRERQVENAVRLFKLMGITREDKEKRTEWDRRGYRFFDAPAAVIVSSYKEVDDLHSQFDLGLVVQTLCLAALGHGVATCIEVQAVNFPGVIRNYTGIPESQRIVIAIALGYPDPDFPANQGQIGREALDNVVSWHGFNGAG
ncbi:MAG: nitroreductase [Chloroflexi bacterium]|nr:nitroreductase [Chloroflexota bacterium]